MAILPKYFYDLSAVDRDGRKRWYDEFSSGSEAIESPIMLSPYFRKEKAERDRAYKKWLIACEPRMPDGTRSYMFKGIHMMKFQAIRVIKFKHAVSHNLDWWEDYQDCLFRVFLQPFTEYDQKTGEHRQWYILSPEDCYLVNQYDCHRAGLPIPERTLKGSERYLPAHPALRCMRLIPVECCSHYRNESTGGVKDLANL